MENILEYSFDDEVVNRFCYDIDNKKIEVSFRGYYDLLKNEFIKAPCKWVIENWIEAKSKLNSEAKYDFLEKHLGIFSLVLSLEKTGQNLEVTVNTVDGRYIDLIFINPIIKLDTIDKG